jgi:hypothetical protein
MIDDGHTIWCWLQYFSQIGIKLAKASGIDLDDSLTIAEKIKFVQN